MAKVYNHEQPQYVMMRNNANEWFKVQRNPRKRNGETMNRLRETVKQMQVYDIFPTYQRLKNLGYGTHAILQYKREQKKLLK
tara:strand:- start:9323 stop:9568 length:246 start_codon:yes stop_codon:yes gene_type:complete